MPQALSEKMRIAVLGGNGYLGSHVSNYFNATPLSRNTGFDITDSSLVKKLKDFDVIINMAALVDKSEKNPERVFKTNSDGTRNIAKVLKQGQTLILVSSKEVYTPNDSYSYSKRIAEEYANYYSRLLNFRLGIFRLSTTYAPPSSGERFVNHFIRSIQEGKELSLLMKGEQIRDFLYVDDFSRALSLFIDSNIQRGIYDIGGGKENSITILNLVKIIGKAIGKSPIIKFSEQPIKGQINYITDLTKINKDLGWKPKIGIEEGIKILLNKD